MLFPMVDHDSFVRLSRSRDFLAGSLDQRLTLSDAASVACLSPYHFHRQFCRAFQETPHEFLRRVRLERARQLLAASDDPITAVCLAVGYESLGSFSTMFRARYGCSPIEFRRGLRRVFTIPGIPPYRFIPCCWLKHYGVPRF
jgi:AraC-like DNA-binding protein